MIALLVFTLIDGLHAAIMDAIASTNIDALDGHVIDPATCPADPMVQVGRRTQYITSSETLLNMLWCVAVLHVVRRGAGKGTSPRLRHAGHAGNVHTAGGGV